ncbi:MAG TPA: 3-phosphoshikimate 1-carboxyvinyltransferase, partial [bacterium]|nr:3-phosphoshikimate 1-carboxyvinyltransferase [bacterium]
AQAGGLAIRGVPRLRGGRAASGGDHRVAMALAVAGLRAAGPVTVDDTDCIRTSFPGFEDALRTLTGA